MTDAAAPSTSVLLVHAADAQSVTLRNALSARPELEVVDEVLTTREAIAAAERLQPRVLVMDVGLDDLVGQGVLRSVRRVAPDTRVVLHARTTVVDDRTGIRLWIAQLVGVILDPVRPAALAARLEVPGEPLGVPMARSFVSEVLDQWDLDGLVPAAGLLVSELVANAVQHVPGPCALELTCRADVLRIAVSDSGPGMPDLRVMTPSSERGRGLHIVSAFATTWGVDQLPDGRKKVWAELDPAEVHP
jgi:anti-sigma regulatory factor (Ser/Thr protein kinase)/CheY-like chemotaxis protein